jgi:hypothetical protein
MYSNNKNIKINIENINLSGDWELNNFIKRSLKRYSSKDASKKYDITIATNYTKIRFQKIRRVKQLNINLLLKLIFL